MKKSSIYLAVLITLILSAGILAAFAIKDKAVEATPFNSTRLLEGKGAYYNDTIHAPYQVIKSDFPIIYLDPQVEDRVIIEGYANAHDHVDAHVSGDTLYVYTTNHESGLRVPDNKVNSEFILRVKIGAKKINGLWLYGGAAVKHEAQPTGQDINGIQVYNKSITDKYKLILEDLNLTLENTADAELWIRANKINLSLLGDTPMKGIYSSGEDNQLQLMGEVGTIGCINPTGKMTITGNNLQLDSLIYHEEKKTDHLSGVVMLNPSKYIETIMYHNVNIIHYAGITSSHKNENGVGRSIQRIRKNSYTGSNPEVIAQLVKEAQDLASQKPDDLRKLSFQETIDWVESDKFGIINGTPTYKNEEGRILTQYEIAQATADSLGADLYVDAMDNIKEIVFRPRTEEDKILMEKISAKREQANDVKPRFINCNDVIALLEEVSASDQAARRSNSQDIATIDKNNLTTVVNILRKCGMPTKAEVGDAINGIWLALQHGPAKYRAEYLPLIEASVARGDLSTSQLALMIDRHLMDEGKPQLYGSQVTKGEAGPWELYQLASPASVDRRRDSMDMEPLQLYLDRFGVEFEVKQVQ